MKFLEVVNRNGFMYLINIDKIDYIACNERMWWITINGIDINISNEEYERITQYIDKVDHL